MARFQGAAAFNSGLFRSAAALARLHGTARSLTPTSNGSWRSRSLLGGTFNCRAHLMLACDISAFWHTCSADEHPVLVSWPHLHQVCTPPGCSSTSKASLPQVCMGSGSTACALLWQTNGVLARSAHHGPNAQVGPVPMLGNTMQAVHMQGSPQAHVHRQHDQVQCGRRAGAGSWCGGWPAGCSGP
jgi:hypothetical protein